MNRLRLSPWALMLLFTASIGAPQTLREKAAKADILIGAAVNINYLSEAAYTTTLSREFNMLEAEDAMKWEPLRPAQEIFDFKDADRIVEFAGTHGMRVRGH